MRFEDILYFWRGGRKLRIVKIRVSYNFSGPIESDTRVTVCVIIERWLRVLIFLAPTENIAFSFVTDEVDVDTEKGTISGYDATWYLDGEAAKVSRFRVPAPCCECLPTCQGKYQSQTFVVC